jgi:hypothetical protein
MRGLSHVKETKVFDLQQPGNQPLTVVRLFIGHISISQVWMFKMPCVCCNIISLIETTFLFSVMTIRPVGTFKDWNCRSQVVLRNGVFAISMLSEN